MYGIRTPLDDYTKELHVAYVIIVFPENETLHEALDGIKTKFLGQEEFMACSSAFKELHSSQVLTSSKTFISTDISFIDVDLR